MSLVPNFDPVGWNFSQLSLEGHALQIISFIINNWMILRWIGSHIHGRHLSTSNFLIIILYIEFVCVCVFFFKLNIL